MIDWQAVQVGVRTNILLKDIHLQLKKGTSLGIAGRNGSGKTVLAKALAGLLPIRGNFTSPLIKILFLSFQSEIHLRHGAQTYRQQRWNPADSDLIPTVADVFSSINNQKELHNLISKFHFEKQLDKMLISLSNGEQRKFELIRALAQEPGLLVIDNAFNGLDYDSRIILHEMFRQLNINGHPIILTGIKASDFPEGIEKFVLLKKQTAFHFTRSAFPSIETKKEKPKPQIPVWTNSSHNELIVLNKVSLFMNGKTILENISWTVKPGECWVLSGKNGSGKTSLLNMIFADNPKAYLYDIRLFGKPRGSGETIWDIKNKIGFVSPEMHQYLPGRQTVNDVVCSGFFGSEGLYKQASSYQRNVAKQWLQQIGLKHLSGEPFRTLSSSTQRMVLIIRSMLKHPPLLLLDEPFQGLDPENIVLMQELLNELARQTNCAMIFVSHIREEIPEQFTLELMLENGKTAYLGIRKK
jgi:molybdate transport system ATP-binding protein